MVSASGLESLIRQDRLCVLGGVIGATALAWLYLVWMVSGTNTMGTMGDVMLSARATPWTITDFTLMFLMWAIMMVGMMLPSATPMILLFAMVNRRRSVWGESAPSPVVVVVSGYLATWTAFSLLATTL